MSQEKFNKLLKEGGLPKESSQKIVELVRAVNVCDNRIDSLESRVDVLNNKKNIMLRKRFYS